MFLCTLENQTKVHNVIIISITNLYFQFQKSITFTIGTILYHNKLHYIHVDKSIILIKKTHLTIPICIEQHRN